MVRQCHPATCKGRWDRIASLRSEPPEPATLGKKEGFDHMALSDHWVALNPLDLQFSHIFPYFPICSHIFPYMSHMFPYFPHETWKKAVFFVSVYRYTKTINSMHSSSGRLPPFSYFFGDIQELLEKALARRYIVKKCKVNKTNGRAYWYLVGCYCSSGWWFQPLWKIWKSVGIIIPNLWKVIKFMFQTTIQLTILDEFHNFDTSPEQFPS